MSYANEWKAQYHAPEERAGAEAAMEVLRDADATIARLTAERDALRREMENIRMRAVVARVEPTLDNCVQNLVVIEQCISAALSANTEEGR